MLKIENKISEVWFENRNLFFYLVTIGCILFTYELLNFSLTVDEEIHIRLIDADITWVQQGRWGMYLLSAMLLPNPVVPVLPLLIGILFSALAYILIVRTFSTHNSTALYISAPLFLGCPTLYYVYHFSTLSYGIGIGLFVAAAGYFIYEHGNDKVKFFSILLFSFAIAIYQAFLLFIIVLFLFNSFIRLVIEQKYTTKFMVLSTAKFIGIISLSLILYFILRDLSYFIYDVKNNNYTSNFFSFTNTFAYWEKTIPATINSMSKHYLGNKSIYGRSLYSLFTLFVISVSILIFKSFKSNNGLVEKTGAVVILLLIIFIPFLLNITNGGFMPTRALISIPTVIFGIVYFSWILSGQYMRIFIGLLAIITSFQFMVVNNKFSFTNQLSWEADKQLAIRIQSRIDELSINTSVPIHLEIVGIPKKRHPNLFPTLQTIGNSFFSFNGGNVHRIILFFNTLAISSYTSATIEERKMIMTYTKEMPIWPDPESIAMQQNILIIKFGEYSYQQNRKLCIETKTPAKACKTRS